MVNKFVQDSSHQPTLLLGDLNAEFDSEVLKRATQIWSIANGESPAHVSCSSADETNRFILTCPTDRWRVKEVKVLEEAVASDHRRSWLT